LPASAQTTIAEQATEQAQRIIESRLDAVGVAEPLVQRHGSHSSHQILVQMPGIQDPERVKQLLKAESKLELVHVVSPPSPAPVQTYNTKRKQKLRLVHSSNNRRVLPYAERNEPTQEVRPRCGEPGSKKWVVVESPAIINGSELRSAAATQAQGGGDSYQISFALKPSGADKFGAWTGAKLINEATWSIQYDEAADCYKSRQVTSADSLVNSARRC